MGAFLNIAISNYHNIENFKRKKQKNLVSSI